MKSQLKFNSKLLIEHLEPSLFARVSYFCLFLLVSCSTFRIPVKSSSNKTLGGHYRELESKDYVDQLVSLKAAFLSTPGVSVQKINKSSERYLQDLANDIIAKNETFFKDVKVGNVTLLNISSPLHFSLPKGQIFISNGLLTKYIKHESMLVGILSYELVRSEKLLYPKQTIVPVGYIPLERIVTFNRLTVEEKMEIHKWAHYLTTRSGFDGEYYLSWLQTQNRNTADFILQVGDANQINREESLFKAFLIKNSEEDSSAVVNKNSSKSFYTFMNSVRDGAL